MSKKQKAPKKLQGLPDPYGTAIKIPRMSSLAWNTISFGFETEKPLPPEPTEVEDQYAVVGYRRYNLDDELYLVGQNGQKQEGRESDKAKHVGDNDYLVMSGFVDRKHTAPAWGCLCGFAAHFWPMSLEGVGWTGALAEVQAKGPTISCETGWRAERIILTKIWVGCPIMPPDALRLLEKRYGVPVEVL